MILVGCGGKANTPSLPAELAPLKSHLAVQSESVEQGTTVVTYGVDLPYEDAYSQVSSLLTKAKWTTSALRIGRSTKVKVAVFNKSKDETVILQDAPGAMDRAPGAGSVTLNHIVRKS